MKKKMNRRWLVLGFLVSFVIVWVTFWKSQSVELKAEEAQTDVSFSVNTDDVKFGKLGLTIKKFAGEDFILKYSKDVHVYIEDIGETNFPDTTETDLDKQIKVDDTNKEIKLSSSLFKDGYLDIIIPFVKNENLGSEDLDIEFSAYDSTKVLKAENFVWLKEESEIIEPDNVFTPTVVPYADVIADVTDWNGLSAALADSTVTVINILNDIQNTGSTPLKATIARNVTINGVTKDSSGAYTDANHLINWGATTTNTGGGIVMSNTAASGSTLTVNNLTFKGTASSPATNVTTNAIFVATDSSSLWTLNLKNISLDSANTKGLAYGPSLSVVVTGQSNNFVSSYHGGSTSGGVTSIDSSWQKVFECRSLKITDEAIVNVDIQDMLYTSSVNGTSRENGPEFVVEKGSTLQGKNVITPMISTTGTYFNFYVGNDDSGKGSTVNLSGATTMTDNLGGMITTSGNNAHYLVNNGSTLELTSAASPTTVMYSSGGVFDVKNSSTLKAISYNDQNIYQGTIRFRVLGNATFNITEDSRLYFIKGTATTTNLQAAALRMSGNSNIINISGGSRVYGENYSGVQTFQYDGGSNQFNLTDYGSKLEVKSASSGGITSSGSINIQGTKGTEFQVSSKGIPFNGGSGSVLEFNEMLYYDFRNNTGGTASSSRVFNLSGSGAAMRSVNSDMSFWKLQSNLDGSPFKAFTLGTIGLSGSRLTPASTFTMQLIPGLVGTQFTSSADMVTFLNTRGQSIDYYARVSGNNASPIVDELRVPTNADKYVIGHVIVPEGVEGERDAWDDEVTVKVKVTKTDGTSYELTGNTSPQSIYGETSRDGMFKIPNITTSGGEAQFLETGDKVEVLEAWRGGADASRDKTHLGVPTDDDRWVTSAETTVDVTPPTPTTVTAGEVTNASKILSGTGAEPGVTGYVGIKSGSATEPTLDTSKAFTVAADGSWTVTMDDYFTAGDEVSIFLQDHAGLATDVVNPPETNKTIGDISGNINPYNDLTYHDATFTGVTKYIVQDIMPAISVTKAVSSSSGNGTTSVGDTLTYTVEVTNSRSDSVETQLNDVTLTDVIPTGLDYVADSVSGDIDGTAITSSNYSYDDTSKTLTLTAGTLMTGKKATFNFETTVTQDLYNSTVTNTVNASGKTIPGEELNDTASVINPGGNVLGTVELVTAPTTIDFGSIEYKAADVVVDNPTLVGDALQVQDTRGSNQATWSLTAKVTTPMTNQDPSKANILADALRYKVGDETKILSAGTSTIVYTKDNGGSEDVSSTWTPTGDGLKLYASSDDMKLGDYEGVIVWTLETSP